MSTVALVPAFRRADRVGATVEGLLPLVDEVVVVDDGSNDGGATVEAARSAGATVVALPANRGKGGAMGAGIAATPDATTYLLVDADTAATAAATAPLLAAVGDGADLAIGVLPPAGGRGGFGAVRGLAAWGIRRACGFEAAAPLSGQRAVRAPVLRALELADRFGVEVGMTIDAVRAGARVVEVNVDVDHIHTGRGVAGFSHRAGQGFDLLRALWPRLVSEPARRLTLVVAAVVLVGLLTGSAVAATPSGEALGRVDAVVLVAAPATLRLEDLDSPVRTELASLAGQRGAVAAANVDVPGRTAWSSWATVGAGTKVRAGPPTKDPDPRQPFLVQDGGAGQGRLGDALRLGGRTTAFVGASPISPVRLAVADGAGRIDRAATAGSLGAAGFVNRTRADLGSGAAVVAVDASELDAVALDDLLAGLRPTDGERRLLLVVTPADRGGRFGLRPMVASGPGAPAGRLVSPSTRRDGLVLLSDVAPTILGALGLPVADGMVGRPLRRLARSPDVHGLVEANRLSRQRNTVWDPALLALVPLHLLTYAWAWRRRHPTWAGGRRRRSARVPTLGLPHGTGGSSGGVSPRRAPGAGRARSRRTEDRGGPDHDDVQEQGGGDVRAAAAGASRSEGFGAAVAGRCAGQPGGRVLEQVALGLLAWPLATWLIRAVPGSGGLGRWAGLAALVADVVLVAVAWRLGRRRGLAPMALVLGATIGLLTLDLGLGGALQVSSAFGGAAHSTGRFTGLGNTAFAVYAGCALLAVACARRRGPWMLALLVLVALVDALPPLGADVGGALTLAPIFAVAAAALWGRLRWRTVVTAGVATLALAGAALAIDLLRPPDARTHLARFVTGDGAGSTVGSKVAQNLATYAKIPILVPVVAITLGLGLLLLRGRFRHALPPGSPARIGVCAAVAVSLLGNLLNDSGPIVTLIAMALIGPYLVIRSVAGEEEPPPIFLP